MNARESQLKQQLAAQSQQLQELYQITHAVSEQQWKNKQKFSEFTDRKVQKEIIATAADFNALKQSLDGHDSFKRRHQTPAMNIDEYDLLIPSHSM